MKGSELRGLRKRRGVTQKELAAALRWAASVVVQVENDALDVPPETEAKWRAAIEAAAAQKSAQEAIHA